MTGDFILLRPQLDIQMELLPPHTKMLLVGAIEQIGEALQQLKVAFNYEKDRGIRTADRLRWGFTRQSLRRCSSKEVGNREKHPGDCPAVAKHQTIDDPSNIRGRNSSRTKSSRTADRTAYHTHTDPESECSESRRGPTDTTRLHYKGHGKLSG